MIQGFARLSGTGGGGGGSGTVTSITGFDSVLTSPGTITTSGTIKLVNDVATPGSSFFYGTNSSGVRGWFALPTGGISLETDGTPNGSQSLLNLVSGTNITLTDDGFGNITIDATGGGTVNVTSPITGDGSSGSPLGIVGTPTQIPYYDSSTGAQVSDSNHTISNGTNPGQNGTTLLRADDGTNSAFQAIAPGVLQMDAASNAGAMNFNANVATATQGDLAYVLPGNNAYGIAFNSHTLTTGTLVSGITIGNGGVNELRFVNDSVAWLWPTSDGSTGQALVTDGSGNLSFSGPFLSTVAVDGTTITGDGTVGNPLVAVAPAPTTPTLLHTQIAFGDSSNLMTSSALFEWLDTGLKVSDDPTSMTGNMFINAGDSVTVGTADTNIGIGTNTEHSLQNLTTGIGNIGIGAFSGQSLSNENHNILLGTGSNITSGNQAAIVMGFNAKSTDSNQFMVGSQTSSGGVIDNVQIGDTGILTTGHSFTMVGNITTFNINPNNSEFIVQSSAGDEILSLGFGIGGLSISATMGDSGNNINGTKLQITDESGSSVIDLIGTYGTSGIGVARFLETNFSSGSIFLGDIDGFGNSLQFGMSDSSQSVFMQTNYNGTVSEFFSAEFTSNGLTGDLAMGDVQNANFGSTFTISDPQQTFAMQTKYNGSIEQILSATFLSDGSVGTFQIGDISNNKNGVSLTLFDADDSFILGDFTTGTARDSGILFAGSASTGAGNHWNGFAMDFSNSALNSYMGQWNTGNNTFIKTDDVNQQIQNFANYNGIVSSTFLSTYTLDGTTGNTQIGDISGSLNQSILSIDDASQKFQMSTNYNGIEGVIFSAQFLNDGSGAQMSWGDVTTQKNGTEIFLDDVAQRVLITGQVATVGTIGFDIDFAAQNYSIGNNASTNYFAVDTPDAIYDFGSFYNFPMVSPTQTAQVLTSTSTGTGAVTAWQSMGVIPHQEFIATALGGSSIGFVPNAYNIITSSGVITSVTYVLPSSPNDGDFVEIKQVQGAMAVIWSGGTVATGTLSAIVGGTFYKLVFDAGSSTWY